jgi:hypothetical protein
VCRAAVSFSLVDVDVDVDVNGLGLRSSRGAAAIQAFVRSRSR